MRVRSDGSLVCPPIKSQPQPYREGARDGIFVTNRWPQPATLLTRIRCNAKEAASLIFEFMESILQNHDKQLAVRLTYSAYRIICAKQRNTFEPKSS